MSTQGPVHNHNHEFGGIWLIAYCTGVFKGDVKHKLFNLIAVCYYRVTDLRQQKQKLSRQVREKEEEIDDLRQQVENTRQETRKVEKSKREVGDCLIVCY